METVTLKIVNDNLTELIKSEIDQEAIKLLKNLFNASTIVIVDQYQFKFKDLKTIEKNRCAFDIDNKQFKEEITSGDLNICYDKCNYDKYASIVYHPPKYNNDFIYEVNSQHIDYKDFANKLFQYFLDALKFYFPNPRSKPGKRIKKRFKEFISFSTLTEIYKRYNIKHDPLFLRELINALKENDLREFFGFKSTVDDYFRSSSMTPCEKQWTDIDQQIDQEKSDYEKIDHRLTLFDIPDVQISRNLLLLLKLEYFWKCILSVVDSKSMKVMKFLPAKGNEKSIYFKLDEEKGIPKSFKYYRYDKNTKKYSSKSIYEDRVMFEATNSCICIPEELTYGPWMEFTLIKDKFSFDIQKRKKFDIPDKYEKYFKNREDWYGLKDFIELKENQRLRYSTKIVNYFEKHWKLNENLALKQIKTFEIIDNIYKLLERTFPESCESDTSELVKRTYNYQKLKERIAELKKFFTDYKNETNMNVRALMISKFDLLTDMTLELDKLFDSVHELQVRLNSKLKFSK